EIGIVISRQRYAAPFLNRVRVKEIVAEYGRKVGRMIQADLNNSLPEEVVPGIAVECLSVAIPSKCRAFENAIRDAHIQGFTVFSSIKNQLGAGESAVA